MRAIGADDALASQPVRPLDRSSSWPARRRYDWIVASLSTGTFVVLARLWTSRGRDLYSIWPDEPAQLAIARYVGSGTHWNMNNHSTWRPGYGTLLSPVYWFTDDPTSIFHGALIVNALLGGVAALLLVLLGRRLTPLSPVQCAAAAAVISIAPTAIFTTMYVWSEALVLPLFLGTLLVLLRFRDNPNVRSGTAAALLAVAAFAAHSRMLPLCLVVAGAVWLETRRRRLPQRSGMIVVAWTAAGFVAVSAYSEFLINELWDKPLSRNSYGGFVGQLTQVGPMITSLVGQSWYLLVTSAGLAGLGAITMVQAARSRAPRLFPASSDARFVLATVGVHVAVSIVFMADRTRAHQVVYGRYSDAVIGPVILIGIAVLVRSSPWKPAIRNLAILAAATTVTGAALYALRGDALSHGGGIQPMILGLQAFGIHGSVQVIRITAIALLVVIGLALAVTTLRRAGARSAVVIVLATLSLVAYARTDAVIDRTGNGSVLPAIDEIRRTVLQAGEPVDYLLPPGSSSTNRMMIYQFYLPHNEFTVVDDPLSDPTATYVFAPLDDATLQDAGARVIWTDPSEPIGLWQK